MISNTTPLPPTKNTVLEKLRLLIQRGNRESAATRRASELIHQLEQDRRWSLFEFLQAAAEHFDPVFLEIGEFRIGLNQNQNHIQAVILTIEGYLGIDQLEKTEVPEKEAYLSAQDAAAYLGVSPHTIRRWRLDGVLGAVLVGKKYMFEQGVLGAFRETLPRPMGRKPGKV